jgi:hypothetical protein
MIEAGPEGVRGVTKDYLDEHANGGPEQFQILQVRSGDQVIQRTLRGKSVWDGYAEAAMAALIERMVGPGDDEAEREEEIAAAVKTAARAADLMLAESRKRNPQPMKVSLGSKVP